LYSFHSFSCQCPFHPPIAHAPKVITEHFKSVSPICLYSIYVVLLLVVRWQLFVVRCWLMVAIAYCLLPIHYSPWAVILSKAKDTIPPSSSHNLYSLFPKLLC
jgi:hypothetical protein